MSNTSQGITGHWDGHYSQGDARRPIRAELTQDGSRLSGTMTDGQTESESSLFDAAAQAGLPPGADETIDAQIRNMVPEAGNRPIRAKHVLPGESQLEGTVDGPFVRFTKTYQGEHFIGYQVGEKTVGEVIEDHCVQYSGRRSSDGTVIEGRWTIPSPESPRGYLDGAFVLRRV